MLLVTCQKCSTAFVPNAVSPTPTSPRDSSPNPMRFCGGSEMRPPYSPFAVKIRTHAAVAGTRVTASCANSPKVSRTVTRDGCTARPNPGGLRKESGIAKPSAGPGNVCAPGCPVPRDSGLKSAQTSQTRVVEYFPLASRPASGLANLLSWE